MKWKKLLYSSALAASMLYGDTYFLATDSGSESLYTTDGTTEGTVKVNLGDGTAKSPISFNNKIYFVDMMNTASYYDGKNVAVDSIISNVCMSVQNFYGVINGKLYFSGGDYSSILHIWSYDGVNPPTTIDDGITYAAETPEEYLIYNNKLYITLTLADNYKELHIIENDQVVYVAKVNTNNTYANAKYITQYNGEIYFQANANTDALGLNNELYKTNGTTTELVVDLNTNESSNPHALTVFNGKLYFIATDDSVQQALYKSDGTAAGTNRIDGVRGYLDTQMAVFNNKLYFNGNTDSSQGMEMIEFDGTSANVISASDPQLGGLNPTILYAIGDKLLFQGGQFNSTYINELWVYNGVDTPSLVKDIYTGTHYDINKADYVENSSNPNSFFEASFAPAITSIPASSVLYDSTYTYIPAVSNMDGNLTWSAKEGTTLPGWLSLGKGYDSTPTLVSDELNYAYYMKFDKDDNLYMSDSFGNITILHTDGSTTVITDFSMINGISIDSDNNLYVTDFDNNTIKKRTPDGNITIIADSSNEINASIDTAFDSAGNMYIINTGDKTIKKKNI